MQTVYQAHAALKLAENTFCRAFIARSTSKQRNSKYWSAGSEEWYESKEYIAVLSEFGYANSDEYQDRLQATPEYIAYKKFNRVCDMLSYDCVEYRSLIKAMKIAGLYDEEDHCLDGLRLWSLAQTHAPKQAQLVELAIELGYDFCSATSDRVTLSRKTNQ